MRSLLIALLIAAASILPATAFDGAAWYAVMGEAWTPHVGLDGLPQTNALVVYYQLAGDAVALVGGSNGTITAGAATNGIHGIAATAIHLDRASNGRIDLGNITALTALTNGTISAWIRPWTNVTLTVFGAADTANSSKYAQLNGTLYLESNRPGFNLRDGVANNIIYSAGAGAVSIPIGSWSHLAVTANGTTWEVYLDGTLTVQLVTSGSNTGKFFNQCGFETANYAIGVLPRAGGSLYNFPGALANVGVWSTPLSSNEVYQIYQRDAP